MDLAFRFDRWFECLPPSPRDAGRVVRLVVRPHDAPAGSRETPDCVRVTVEGGVEGDRWSVDPGHTPENQVSLINAHVIDDLAGGAQRAPLCGDNLHVDLDLSEENLPVGTRLKTGSAVLEVTSMPHRACASFAARYGPRAAKRVARATRVGRRGRGVLCRVVQGGEVALGDTIAVEGR